MQVPRVNLCDIKQIHITSCSQFPLWKTLKTNKTKNPNVLSAYYMPGTVLSTIYIYLI